MRSTEIRTGKFCGQILYEMAKGEYIYFYCWQLRSLFLGSLFPFLFHIPAPTALSIEIISYFKMMI